MTFRKMAITITAASLTLFGCNEGGFNGSTETKKSKPQDSEANAAGSASDFLGDSVNEGEPGTIDTIADGGNDAVDLSDLQADVADKKGAPTPGDKNSGDTPLSLLEFDCDSSPNREVAVGPNVSGEHTLKIKDDQKVAASVRGRLCPKLPVKLNVIFIIDTSGSMQDNGNSDEIPEGGSDPLTAGTCGRYNAVRELVDSLDSQTDEKKGDEVQIGAIFFSDTVNREMEPKSLQEFRSAMRETDFCAGDGWTNYGDALSITNGWAKSLKGKTVGYLVSDGSPQVESEIPDKIAEGSALDAMDRLKKIKNFELYSVFLGRDKELHGYQFLQQLVPLDHIGFAEDPDELAEVFEEFGDNILDSSSGKAIFEVSPYEPTEIKLKELEKVGEQDDGTVEYVFETEGAVLLGLDDKWVDNLFTITFTARDGSEVESRINFKYCKSGCPGNP